MANLFSISPQHNFIEALTSYLVLLKAHNPLLLAHYTLYLPSRRACLKLTQALQKEPGVFALPKMYGLNDLDTLILDHGFCETTEFKKPLISPLKQVHVLTRLLMQAKPELSLTQALSLGEDLLKVMNEFLRDDIDLAQLNSLKNHPFSERYHKNLELLRLVIEHYPHILSEWGLVDPLQYKKKIYEILPKYWQSSTDRHFIIAGITQYQKDSITLLTKSLAFSNTTVILPFVDGDILHEVQDVTSPHYHTHKIVERLAPNTLKSLPSLNDKPSKMIQRLTSGTAFSQGKEVAHTVFRAIEDGEKSISIVTPDRGLATRLKTELHAFGLPVNDSSPLPFDQTPLGHVALLAAKVITHGTLSDYLQLMKHPLVCPLDTIREDHLKIIYVFEVDLRTKPLLSKQLGDYDYPYKDKIHVNSGDFLTTLKGLLDHLVPNIETEEADIFSKHLVDLQELTHIYKHLSKRAWHDIFHHSLKGISIPQSPPQGDININIIGLMEARVEKADVMIITGLEEGILPRRIDPDPWLSPHIRRILNLPTPEELTGLQAQDFFMSLSGASKIILSRSLENGGVPVLSSRFWYQVEDTQEIDQKKPPSIRSHRPALPTMHGTYLQPPCPSHTLKPTRLSVSALKLLMEDSYGFYAQYILRLRRLCDLDEDTDALIFGQYLHEALDKYSKSNHRFNIESIENLHAFIINHFKDTPLTFMQKVRLHGFCDWLCEYGMKGNVATEVLMERSITVGSTTFTFFGTADRIDTSHETITIMDYKTGQPPSHKAIEKGYAPQLPVEGWIMEK
ncbi:MAG: PD-(D/E)XK nuclease family protein, partial [Alphaproteobacteria bacterium]|nr:PD-(D/E)XK nuclease family protein [Alphaproteobacteria bacterium]